MDTAGVPSVFGISTEEFLRVQMVMLSLSADWRPSLSILKSLCAVERSWLVCSSRGQYLRDSCHLRTQVLVV